METITSISTAATADTFRPAIRLHRPEHLAQSPQRPIFHDGVFHLYYRTTRWITSRGNMSWGHATSPDLVYSTAAPRRHRLRRARGHLLRSIAFDWDNTSGLGTDSAPPLVAVYTSAFKAGSAHAGLQAQSLAFSLDGGYTWDQTHRQTRC